LSAGELQDLTRTEQSALSHQLRVLRDAGLVRTTRDGRKVIYHLQDEHVAHIVEDALIHATEPR
ncbi:MAG: metalloregulator ArsR/SmtB family transcription factor, partial [Candidatus Latescibacterota bacterium]|nr:metalloregulator ArsR/SmtB family transcription factor [Candidatus Latescibacterota bacterium]